MMISAKKVIRACVPRSIRNWLRSPTRAAAWIWDEIQHLIGLNRTVQMRSDWSLLCHPAAYRFAYYAQDTDPEQVDEFNGFISNCHPGMVLFDIGAHFGLFSFAALHYGGSTAKAIAVDPSPTALRIIRIQALLNSVADRLSILQASAGDQTGWQDMVAVGVLSGGYFVAPAKDHTASELTPTRQVTLDSLVQDFGVYPTHIKIDVEGRELAVLRGGRDILSRATGLLLFIELHNHMVSERGGDPRHTLTLLNDLGYHSFTVKGERIMKENILSRPLVRIIARRTKDS